MRPLMAENHCVGSAGREKLRWSCQSQMPTTAGAGGVSQRQKVGCAWLQEMANTCPCLGAVHGPLRSQAKSHPTAATKIEAAALTGQSDMRPLPSSTLSKRRAQGPTSKKPSSPIARTQGRLDRQEATRALHIDLSSTRRLRFPRHGTMHRLTLWIWLSCSQLAE
jgi:hypothetical protein